MFSRGRIFQNDKLKKEEAMRFYGRVFFVLILSLVVALTACKKGKQKVLFIDSYHQGYEWSDGEIKGAQ